MDIVTLSAWIVGLIAVALGLGMWLMLKSYPYKIRLRETTSSGVEIIHDKIAKVAVDGDKIEHLRLFGKIGQNLKSLPLPPSEVKSYDPKKRKTIVEGYYSEEDGVTYIKPDIVNKGFQPFTTKQRQMMVNQIYRMESRKVKKWTEHIPLIVSLGALVAITAVILLFWGEAIAPIQQAASTSTTAIEKATELIREVRAWERGEQIVSSVAGG